MTPSGPGVVLVTGGRRGIGRAVAERFLADGWSVALNDIDESGLQETVASLASGGIAVSPHPADVGDRAQVEEMFGEVLSCHGRLDAVVVNAGLIRFAPFTDYSTQDFEDTIRVNLLRAFHCAQVAARHWIGVGARGALVLISSASAHQARPGHGAYGSSKAGVEMLAKVAAMELAPHRIQVNCVSPGGPIMTELVAPPARSPEFEERIRSVVPMGRTGAPSEVAEVVRFLAGEKASFMTGAVVAVDGGVTLGRL
ncbi:MAG TPA: SDR family oxidoreductase [Acidimicrobiia bacterium]|nr:SDR family oxidoreductase [Acidimicrobiia bacterium]